MGLFSRKKETAPNAAAAQAPAGGGSGTKVTVMGPGCKSCHQLNENALAAVAELGLPIEVEYVTDPVAIAESGVMSMPALFIDGQLVSSGKALPVSDIKVLLGGE